MNTIISDFYPQIRSMASQILVLSFSNWVLCIPFASFAIKKIVDLLKKIY